MALLNTESTAITIAPATITTKTSSIDALTQQILGQKTTEKWSGEGYGGAEANAKAMAKLLVDAGITDIKQFGKVALYEPVQEISKTYNGEIVRTSINEDTGQTSTYIFKRTGQYDQDNNETVTTVEIPKDAKLETVYGIVRDGGESGGYIEPVDTSKLKTVDGKLSADTGGTTFGNKLTGQAINRGTGRWEGQGGDDLFSGTGEGSGNTAFRAQISPDGTPIFYTTKGSSSDLPALMPLIQLALAATGAGGLLGNALLGAGASQIAAGALGNAILGGATTALAGGDWKKGALLGGAGGALGSYLNTAGGAVLGDASDIAMQMADAGATLTEIETALTNSGFSADVVADSLKDAANTLAPRAIDIPSNVSSLTDAVNVVGQSVAPSLSNLISTIATIPSTTPTQVTSPSTTQTVNVEAARTPQQVDQTILDLVNSQIASNVTTPSNLANVQVTAPKATTTQDVINTIAATIPATTTPVTTPTAVTPTTAEVKVTAPKTTTTQDIINAITTVVPTAVTPPVVPTVTPSVVPTQTITAQKPSTITDAVTAATIPLIQPTTPLTVAEVKAQTDLTNSEKIRLAQLGLTAAGLLGAGAVANSGGSTQYDIVPVPTDWTSPQTIAQTYNYPRPIDFGNRNLLMGTQWEKFLDPNYGRVPEPTIYSQPSNLSYNDLMSILGSKSGMPSASSLSINDIVSGIQNQYGQVPSRTMG